MTNLALFSACKATSRSAFLRRERKQRSEDPKLRIRPAPGGHPIPVYGCGSLGTVEAFAAAEREGAVCCGEA